MSLWKVITGAVVLAAILWLLYPSRQMSDGAGGEVVEISFMGPGGPLGGAMADAVHQFENLSREAHARDGNCPVYRVISGQNAARDQVSDPTRFLISVAGGTPPDVVFFDRFAVAEWAYRGAFIPLDEYIQRDRQRHRSDVPDPNDYYASCWNEAMLKGRVYGIPNSVDDRALFYNKDLLKKAGLVDANGEAKPPRDWEELKDYAVKLTERDAAGRLKVVGFAPLFGNSWPYMYGWMNGARFLSPDGRQVTLNDPRMVEALQYLRDVYDAVGGYDAVNGFSASFQGGELDPFIQGKVAMKIDGFWTLVNLATYGPDVDFGVVAPPVSKSQRAAGNTRVTWNGGWAYAIPGAAHNKEGAWEFIKFMTSPRAIRIQAEASRDETESQGHPYIPGQSAQIRINDEFYEKYVYSNPRMPQRIKDGCRIFNEMLPNAYFRPVTPVGQFMWNQQNWAADAALYHTRTPQSALDYATSIVQRDLDRVLSPPVGRPFNTRIFLAVYVALLIAAAVAVYYWDTRLGFRRWLGRALHRPHRDDAVVEGAGGGFFRRQWAGGVVCALPWIVGFIVFGGGPMLFSLAISFCDYDILNPPRFTGVQNYAWMLTQDDLLPQALWNTLFMVMGVPAGMAVSLSMALLLNVKIRGIAVWRTLFYLPSIVPMVAGSILWVWLLNPEGGLVNQFLRCLGMHGPLWLQSPAWAKPSLILMGLWGAGGGMIIWLAGLKGISEQLYEAAALDGANAWQKLRYVTLPQLTPYIFFNLVMGLIGTFQIFGQAFIMTQGGPVNSTLFYVYHLFNNAFRYGHMGYAAAMAWVLVGIVLVLTVVQFKLSKRWVHYESE